MSYLIKSLVNTAAPIRPGVTVQWSVNQVREVDDSLLQIFANNPAAFTVLSGPGQDSNTIAALRNQETYGWQDITAEVDTRGTGANDPTFQVYTGTNLRSLKFSATVMQECFITFHMPHDYVPGTDIHFHAHWSNAAVAPNTGGVVWAFEYAFAKGFNQAAFPDPTTIAVTQACPATRYQHMVAETAAVTIAGLEVDGLILVRCYRDAANGADTCSDAVFLHTADVHYQSNSQSTKNKAPNFYS